MKRTTVVMSGGAVTAVALLAAPGIAYAQEEEGGHAETQEAPNPILPEANEIIWGALSFAILTFFMIKLAFPAVKKAMDTRTEKIRESLDDAERTRGEAQQILEDYQRQLADAKNEAARIIEEARQAADAMRRELMAKAEAESAQIRERAQTDIQASVDRAQSDLRSSVAALAVEAAEMVVQRALTDRETQVQLVEDYINSVGSQRG
jgi:F-type H+-transporting ATPase subunit b